MERRREKQLAYNQKHRITPRTIQKAVQELEEFQTDAKRESLSLMREACQKPLNRKNLPYLMEDLEKQMREAAENLDFELAVLLRDQLFELREMSGIRGGRPSAKKPRKLVKNV